MKKPLALILSLALALSLCLAGFAESMEGDPPEVLPDTAAPLTEDTTLPGENPAAENPPQNNSQADPPSVATLTTWAAETTEQTLPPFSVSIAATPTPIRTAPKTNSLLVVIVAVIIVIAVMGVIASLVILKYHSDGDDEWERPARQKAAKPKPRYQSGQKPKQTIPREEDPEWDDLSDLDLSYYLDDEDDL